MSKMFYFHLVSIPIIPYILRQVHAAIIRPTSKAQLAAHLERLMVTKVLTIGLAILLDCYSPQVLKIIMYHARIKCNEVTLFCSTS